MAEAVTATFDILLTALHTVALGLSDADDPTITHDLDPDRGTLNGNSSVALTKTWSDTDNLTAGTAELDLTALDFSNLPDVNFNGLKVKLLKIKCPSTNSAGVVFAPGAANPYDLFGDANGQLTVMPGAVYAGYMVEQLEDVDATHKVIDITSGDVDAAYSILMAAGGT